MNLTDRFNDLIGKIPYTSDSEVIIAGLTASRKQYHMGLITEEQALNQIRKVEAWLRTLPGFEKSELETLKDENARLRYELELLKNPAEKHLHDELNKAVGDALDDKAAEEIERLRAIINQHEEEKRLMEEARKLLKK